MSSSRPSRSLLSAHPGLALLLVAAVFLTGCGGSGDSEGGGPVSVDGSSTVYPLTEAVAEEFMTENRGARVTVGVSGTGGGFSKFIRGETDINNASRPITEGERERAEKNGVEFIELPVAYDGLAVMVHPKNDWVDCLSVNELRQIWKPGSSIERWSQIREEFPDRPIQLFGPGTASGTYDYFTEAVVGEGGASRSDFTASEDDNVLVQGISGTPNALGFFGLAYYQNNADQLKLLGIDPDKRGQGASCTKPSAETVQSGSYRPLSRPLFIYVNAARADDPTVESFVEFYLQNAGDLAGDVGYVGLSEEAYKLALERFQHRTTGTLFGAETVDVVGTQVEEVLRRAAESKAPADTGATDTTATE